MHKGRANMREILTTKYLKQQGGVGVRNFKQRRSDHDAHLADHLFVVVYIVR